MEKNGQNNQLNTLHNVDILDIMEISKINKRSHYTIASRLVTKKYVESHESVRGWTVYQKTPEHEEYVMLLYSGLGMAYSN
jgi:hypothetical protein